MKYNQYIRFTKITDKIRWAAGLRKLPFFKSAPLRNIFDLADSLPFQIENFALEEKEIHNLFSDNSEYECIEYKSEPAWQEDPELPKAKEWYESLPQEHKDMVGTLIRNSQPRG